MSIQNLSLLKALGAKMGYLNQRQSVISQNIANADTPNYKPMDLKKADFSSLLGDLGQDGSKPASLMMVSTNAGHMTPGTDIAHVGSERQKTVYEVSPTGNGVVMEEQLLNAGENSNDYNLMTSLYQKQVRMIKTAIGTA